MAYAVTKLVRSARLPRTMRRRPEVKAVLLALADRCDESGGSAFPAVSTIAAECEIGARTVDKCLLALRDEGFIEEQHPPGQHRPRTYRIRLDRLTAASGPHPRAALTNPAGSQTVAALSETSDPQNSVAGSHVWSPDPQNRRSGSQPVATDPVLRSGGSGPLKKVHERAAERRGSKSSDQSPAGATVPLPMLPRSVPAAAAQQQISAVEKDTGSDTVRTAPSPNTSGMKPSPTVVDVQAAGQPDSGTSQLMANAAHGDDEVQKLADDAYGRLAVSIRHRLECDARESMRGFLESIRPAERADLIRRKVTCELRDWRVRQDCGVLEQTAR